MQLRVGEDGKNIFKENTWRREVRKLSDGGVESYLKIGEFGGAGGGGGGESGVFGGVSGGIWCVRCRMRGGGGFHGGKGRRREKRKR